MGINPCNHNHGTMPRTTDYTGKTIAGKIILGRAEDTYAKSPKWLWRCLTCGFEGAPASWCNLRVLERKGCKSCRNCMTPRLKSIPVGTQVNNLIVIGPCKKDGRNPCGSSKRYVPCRCVECGKEGWWQKCNFLAAVSNCNCHRESQNGLSNTRVGILWTRARKRAQDQGVPFTITHDDIVIPETCPVLGIKLEHATAETQSRKGMGGFHDASPTLDKIVPELGYVPGNIAVISWRANRLKGDGTLDEIEAVAAWMRTQKKGQDAA